MSLNPVKSFVGTHCGPYPIVTSEEMFRAFASAVGDTYSGEAPPTWITLCRLGEFDLMTKMGIPIENVLHGDQEYHYLSPIHPGDVVNYSTVLAQALRKRGKDVTLTFMVFETDLSVAGQAVAHTRSTLIYREILRD